MLSVVAKCLKWKVDCRGKDASFIPDGLLSCRRCPMVFHLRYSPLRGQFNSQPYFTSHTWRSLWIRPVDWVLLTLPCAVCATYTNLTCQIRKLGARHAFITTGILHDSWGEVWGKLHAIPRVSASGPTVYPNQHGVAPSEDHIGRSRSLLHTQGLGTVFAVALLLVAYASGRRLTREDNDYGQPMQNGLPLGLEQAGMPSSDALLWSW
jgi:hypothetical protein